MALLVGDSGVVVKRIVSRLALDSIWYRIC